jgi:thiamine pyrophosphate-dependent acetolactate synthase large subunit-like protein
MSQIHRDRAWLAELRDARQRTEARRAAEAGCEAARISPWRLARELRDALPKDAITVFDGNLVMAACQRMIPAYFPVSRLTPGSSGGLGVGIPYAMAAKIEHPERPVVAICGDFAFGLAAMELETAVRHKVPIVVVVANNDGNGSSLRLRMHLADGGAESGMMFQPGLRYERIMATFGGRAEHVDRPGDIGPALARALAGGRPACINVAVDPDAPFPAD